MMDDANSQNFIAYQRIGPNHMSKFVGKPVSVIGKFAGMKGEIVYLKMDETMIGITGLESIDKDTDFIMEVRGILIEEGILDIKEYSCMSNNFDLKQYYQVVNLMQGQFRDLFYGDKEDKQSYQQYNL